MKKSIPNWTRVALTITTLISSAIVFLTGVFSGGKIIECGNEMSRLRSVSGTTVDEAYYQLHGDIYSCFGYIIVSSSIVIFIMGISISLRLISPILLERKEEIKEKVSKIKETTVQIKDASQRVVNVISSETKSLHNKAVNIEGNAEHNKEEDPTKGNFCNNCGAALLPSAKFCTSCGKNITDTTIV